MNFPDYDNLIGFWILHIPYVWIGHQQIEKCKRIYLIPSFTFHENDRYSIIVYSYNQTYIKTLLGSTFFDDLYLLDKYCDNHSNIFRLFFQVGNIFDTTILLDFYKKQGYFCEIRKVSESGNNLINEKFIPQSFHNSIMTNKFVIKYNNSPSYKNFSLDIKKHSNTFSEYPGITFYKNINELSQDMKIKEYSSYEMQGNRPNMEDTSLFCKLSLTDNYNIFIIAVLDGHGDDGKASYHFSREIPRQLHRLVKNSGLSEKTIEEAFLIADENFYLANYIPGGTCFSGVILDDENIFIVNLGDSRTTILLDKEKITTVDHSPKNPDEINRILHELNKNNVNKDTIELINHILTLGSNYSRLMTKSGGLGLNVFRTLGDVEYKYDYFKFYENRDLIKTSENVRWLGANSYISPLPDVQKIERKKYKNEMANILIHCDGINEPKNMKDEEVIIKEYFKNKNNSSERICSMAFKNNSNDNLSMITMEYKI